MAKAKAVRPHVEKMITLGKKGDLHSRRQALSFLQTDKAVTRLFDTVAPRYGDRQGGYLRIVRTGFQKGDGAEKAFIELLGAEKQLDEKRQKRAEVKAKKRKELESSSKNRRNRKPAKRAAKRLLKQRISPTALSCDSKQGRASASAGARSVCVSRRTHSRLFFEPLARAGHPISMLLQPARRNGRRFLNPIPM